MPRLGRRLESNDDLGLRDVARDDPELQQTFRIAIKLIRKRQHVERLE